MKLRSGAVLGIVLVFMLASRHFVLDDGLIYARFIRNALQGAGLVFNPGESVNSLTSPLFSYLLLAVSWLLHGHILLAEHLLYGLALAAACILAEGIVPWSGLFIASTAYFYALIGLETSLFLFMILLVVLAYAKGWYNWLPMLLVLTVLTRFEGGLLIPIVGFLLWRERKWPRAASVLPAALVVLVYLVLNHHWYGQILPNSALSKFGQARSGYWGKWPMGFLRPDSWAVRGRHAFFFWTIYIIPLTAWFGFLGWRRVRSTRTGMVLAPFWLGLLLFYVLSNMPNYTWYYAPIISIPMIFAVAGVPATRISRAGLAVVLAAAGVTNLWFVTRYGPTPEWDYVNVSQWLEQNSPKGATIATMETGHVAWYTDHPVIDILGLTLPRNAEHVAHRDPSSWLQEDRPDFILVHRPLWPFEAVTAEHPEYQELPFHSGAVYILRRVGPFRVTPR